MSLDKERKFSSSYVFLRRDIASSGKSEFPITQETLAKNYFIRQWSVSWEEKRLQVHAGDFLIGWGQGTAFHVRPGDLYRPFLITDTQAKIKPNTSSYENRGLSGLALSQDFGNSRILVALGRTMLDGRLSPEGQYVEDLRTLQDRFWGEVSRPLDLERRDVLTENLGLLRWEKPLGESLFGVAASFARYSREVKPQPRINELDLPNRWEWAFQGREAALLSVDGALAISDDLKVFSEQSLSLWDNKKAPAFILALQKDQTRGGVFYFHPFYFWRHADGARLDSDLAVNRQGFFLTHFKKSVGHNWGTQFYMSQNIKSEFSGSSNSHRPPDSRVASWLRLDDELKIAKGWKLYGRSDISQEPYFIDAQDDPRVKNIWEFKERLEVSREVKGGTSALGFDYARALAQGNPNERSHGWDVYLKNNIKVSPSLNLYAKVLYFDIGPALFKTRYLYLSSSEIYWRDVYLASIVNESLFASFDPQGARVSFSLEQEIKDFASFWIKLGNTNLMGPLASFDRWDFKSELVFKW